MCLVFALIRSFLSLFAPKQPAVAMLAVLLGQSEVMLSLTKTGLRCQTPRLQTTERPLGTPAKDAYDGYQHRA